MLRLLALALVVLVLSAATCSKSQPPSPSNGEPKAEHEGTAANKHSDTQTGQPNASPPITINIYQSPSEYHIATETKGEGHWYTSAEWWTAGFTGLLFVATTGLWIFTALLWRTTRRAVIDGQQGIRTATSTARATIALARATRRQADVAERHLTILERPYFYVSDARAIEAPRGSDILYGKEGDP